ncbi:hypothetical protein STEG23_004051 [Scotinomys teguina]
MTSQAGTPWRKEQTKDLQQVLKAVDQDIPLVLVSGNHDLGNVPTAETVEEFCQTWGDDYFSFWVGGVLFLVLNSQFFYDSSKCPALKQAQDHWLDQQLSMAEQQRCRHAIVFQHIPLFLQRIDEDDDYFNLTKAVRKELADKLTRAALLGMKQQLGCWLCPPQLPNMAVEHTTDTWKQWMAPTTEPDFQPLRYVVSPPLRCALSHMFVLLMGALLLALIVGVMLAVTVSQLVPGIRAVFSGHYHRNAGGTYQDLDMVVSSAIGCQLGKDTHGLRVVVITAEKIVHRYYSLEELSKRGIDDDLKELMKE